MADSTETFWSVDGVSLQTMAWNITSLGGDRMAPPKVRGDDVVIPYQPGATFQPKVPDVRTISLGMWVIGADENGLIPQNENARRTFDRNWQKLRKLLWRYRQEFTLGKRFWVPSADLVSAGAQSQAIRTEGGWSLIYAETKAYFVDGLAPQMAGPARASFTVDLRLCDPYFYSAPISKSFTVASPTQSLSVLGDDRTHNISISFGGPLTNPRMTATNYSGTPYFEYGAALVSGAVAEADVKNFKIQKTQSGVVSPVSGYAKNSGSKFWFYLDPGSANLHLSVTSGTGSANLSYRPAWL